MKNLFFMLTLACFVCVSCDGFMTIPDENNQVVVGDGSGESDDNGGSDNDGNVGGDNQEDDLNSDSGTNVLDTPIPMNPSPLEPEEQKEKIEDTFVELLDEFPSEEYKELIELASTYYNYSSEHFNDDFDISGPEDVWEDEMLDAIFTETSTEEGYEYILRVSKFKGVMTVGEDIATYEPSDSESKVILEDVEGKEWVLDLKPTKWAYDLYVGSYDDESLTADIPSEVVAQLQVDGEIVAEIKWEFEYKLSDGGVDLNQDAVSVRTTFRVDDVSLAVEGAAYDAGLGEGSTSFMLSKGDKQLLNTKAAVKASATWSEDKEILTYNINSASCTVDVLGKLQIVGTMTNAQSFLDDYDENIIDDHGELSKVQDLVEAFNERVNVGISYDGGQTAHAKMVVDYFECGCGDSYNAELVVVFDDDTRYSFSDVFEKYFEDDVDNWDTKYDEYVGSYIELVETLFNL